MRPDLIIGFCEDPTISFQVQSDLEPDENVVESDRFFNGRHQFLEQDGIGLHVLW